MAQTESTIGADKSFVAPTFSNRALLAGDIGAKTTSGGDNGTVAIYASELRFRVQSRH